MKRRAILRMLFVVALAALPHAGARAGLLAPPPGLTAMWEGKDGTAVRAALRRYAAEGEAPGASAQKRLEAGEAAYWLGVQDARAGRADSALAQWRRAMKLRGDYDEGFALVDALFRRGRPADITEAYGVAAGLAQVAGLEMPRRAPEAHARLAWARHLRGHSDSALAEIREWSTALQARPMWARRFAEITLAGGEPQRAWPALTLLSARTNGQDAAVESLLVRAQHRARFSDEDRRNAVAQMSETLLAQEQRGVRALGGRFETARAKDGFPLRWLEVPAAAGVPRRAALLYVLSGADSLGAVDTLVSALAAAGHPVVLLAPRGSFGAIGKGAYGPESWYGREAQLHAAVAGDAVQVVDLLEKRGFAAGAGWIAGAAGDLAPVALELARARKNVGALLLVAPRLPVVEIAEYRARLRAAGARVFIQVSPEEPDALELADLVARFTNSGQVRVADSGLAGRGAAIFRAEPRVTQRLLAWLEEKPAAK